MCNFCSDTSQKNSLQLCGSCIACIGSYDHTFRLWDTVTGAALQTLDGHSIWVSSVAFSPDGRLVVSGSSDNTVQLWDAATGALQQTLEGYSDMVKSIAVSNGNFNGL